jgi:hypothetical protein
MVSITILKADIKRKCRITSSDTSYDTDIDALIAETQPGIEYTISDKYINDTGNIKLQGILKLGMLEIISGEFLQQLARADGSGSISIGGISIGAAPDHGAALIIQGNTRLQPFRKAIDGMSGEASVQSSSSDRELQFGAENTEVW